MMIAALIATMIWILEDDAAAAVAAVGVVCTGARSVASA
jgi:hypothetical protein